MKEFLKKNFTIVLAFALPLMVIVIVALSTYIPPLLLSTNYNFIYSSCDNTNYYSDSCGMYLQKRYSVVNNKLTLNTIDPNQDLDGNKILDINENYIARIFLHDTKKNESREITVEEAQMLSLNSLLTSPDGITISSNYGNNPGDFLFIFGGSSSSYGYYLTKGKGREKLNLIHRDSQYYYQNNFHFIGWVVSGKN